MMKFGVRTADRVLFPECAIVDSSAVAASAAKTGLSGNTDGLRASISGTTITFTFADRTGAAFSYTAAPVVQLEQVGSGGTVTLTSSAAGTVVVDVDATTTDFHISVWGTKKSAV